MLTKKPRKGVEKGVNKSQGFALDLNAEKKMVR